MNDPGLDAPISDDAKAVEVDQNEDRKEEEIEAEDEQAFLNPSRWWFASTAFPLLAGTFGPMASAFSVCALVENWRVVVPPGGNEAHGIDVKDPKWLIAVNAVSLTLALIANFALLLNMARRLSFSVAQSVTIIGWYISSILLISLVAAAVHIVKIPGENRALTQAFYYAIIAAMLYFIIATLMTVTVYGAYKGHYAKDFKLTMSQRTLMLQTISFMVYMIAGAAVYAKVEKWKFLDAVYFTNYTLLTVGIGDYAPSTHLGRGLLFPYAIGGIVTLGLVVGSIRSLVLERGKKKLGSRMIEKKREALLKNLRKKEDTARLIPVGSEEHAAQVGMNERERRKQEFYLMREIQDRASVRQKWTALIVSGTAWFILWFVGAVVFWKAEHAQTWSYFEAVYFSYTSLLTIGYGDLAPFSNAGKPFFVFWSLLAVPTLTILISNMGDTVVKSVRDLTLYLGEFTVLPGEVGIKDRAVEAIAKLRFDKVLKDGKAHVMNEPPSYLGEKKSEEESKSQAQDVRAAAADDAAKTYEHEELEAAEAARERGDTLLENFHEYHYLLAREFRNVMKHLNENPPRKYTYEEWAWFLKLMREDEASINSHRRAPIKVQKPKDSKPDTQQAQSDDKDNSLRQWSWLGNRSPLMGETEEAEWVLERLSNTLERELKKQFEAGKRSSGAKGVPHHSVARNSNSSNSSSPHAG